MFRRPLWSIDVLTIRRKQTNRIGRINTLIPCLLTRLPRILGPMLPSLDVHASSVGMYAPSLFFLISKPQTTTIWKSKRQNKVCYYPLGQRTCYIATYMKMLAGRTACANGATFFKYPLGSQVTHRLSVRANAGMSRCGIVLAVIKSLIDISA